jgi:hypothetical protein
MKNIVKGTIRNEKGYVLITVLILLLVGGLILTPLLGLMSAGLLAGQVYEKKTDELYAADAGVEDAIWRIQTNNLTFVNDYSGPWDLAVNGKNVTVEVYREDMDLTPCIDDFTYQILSTAATDDGGGTAAIDSSTTIDAHITTTVDYCSMLDHLLTIHESLDQADVIHLNNDLAKLNIPCGGCDDCDKCAQAYDYDSDAYRDLPKECRGCVAVYNFPDAAWPTVSELSARYLNDVEDGENWPSTVIDLIGGDVVLNATYVNGTFAIGNTDNKVTHNITLNGTLYITGETEIGVTGGGTNKPSITVDLNGNTIFVASNSTGNGHEALQIGAWCGITGPGAIIAVGDIYFKPNQIIGTNPEPAFVLSVSATTKIQSGAAFVGAIGSYGKDACLQSGGGNVAYPTTGFPEINFFPVGLEVKRTYSIATWEINPP